jgi:hypothetical protein
MVTSLKVSRPIPHAIYVFFSTKMTCSCNLIDLASATEYGRLLSLFLLGSNPDYCFRHFVSSICRHLSLSLSLAEKGKIIKVITDTQRSATQYHLIIQLKLFQFQGTEVQMSRLKYLGSNAMVFREIIAVYCENHKEHINRTLRERERNVERKIVED